MKNITILTILIIFSACSANSWNEKKKSPPPAANSQPTAPEVTEPLNDDPAFLTPITNLPYLLSSINIEKLLSTGQHGQTLKIAILDNGFSGLKDSLGQRLPPDLVVFSPDDAKSLPTPHGTKLAEIVFGLTSGSPFWTKSSQNPQLKLYNSNGFSNFSRSVDQAIADKVDIILYSQVWEYGGNFDGQGFINSIVNKAVNAGILWINAAGNYASSSWQGSVVSNSDHTAQLPFENEYVRLVVNDAATRVKITLSWNDFSDSKEWKTSRDLDLFLLDRTKKMIASSIKIQDGKEHDKNSAYSAHAREIIETTLDPGVYLIRVDLKSENFDKSSRLRIAADGQGISFIDQSSDASIMIPADNPNVLTIGANDDFTSSHNSLIGSTSKPEVVAPSIVEFQGGMSIQGSSTAAAVATGALAVYMGHCGKLNRDQIQNLVADGSLSQLSEHGRGLWISDASKCP